MLGPARDGPGDRAAFDALSGLPHRRQNVAPLGFSWPHEAHAGWIAVPQYGQ